MHTIDSLVTGVRDLVTLPDSYLRLRQACSDRDNGPNEIAAIVRNDPVLTARILRIANSAYFGLIAEVDTVPRAVQVLGMKFVEMMALADAAANAFDESVTPGVDLRDFWQRSLWCASMARRLAMQTNRTVAPESAFVCGLLHDIGHLVLATNAAGELTAAQAEALSTGKPVHEIEQHLFGFDYAQVGGALLESWQLPASIVEPLAFHTRPECYPDDGGFRMPVTITHIAATLAHSDDRETAAVSSISESALDTLALYIGDSALDMLEISVEKIVETLAITDDDAEQIGSMMMPGVSGERGAATSVTTR